MKKTNSNRKFLKLPSNTKTKWEDEIIKELKITRDCKIELNCQDWYLNCKQIKILMELCLDYNCIITKIKSNIPETIVSAKALSLPAELNNNLNIECNEIKEQKPNKKEEKVKIFFHQGTLRSGESIEIIEDLFIFGDVNPGAIVSSNGNVFIWGRLLGIAHAGKGGKEEATISALQLRPLQLRIANKVARGPQEKSLPGLAEEAKIESGEIVIRPAKTMKK